MMGIENIEILSREVMEKFHKLKEITKDVTSLDFKRLEKVIEVSKDSICYDKIWSKKRTIVPDNEENFVKTIYTDMNADGNILKGVKVGSRAGEGNFEDNAQEYIHEYELWLTPDGFIETEITGRALKGVISNSELNRVVLKKDVDIFDVDEECNYIWDLDTIVSKITERLVSRVDSLNKRLEEQEERLSKLKDLNI